MPDALPLAAAAPRGSGSKAAGAMSAAERAEGLVVTALALALLRDHFAALADLWEVAARKASATLAGEGAALTAATARAEELVALKG